MPLNRFAARTLRSATTNIDIAAATAPTSGQVLTATGTTAATWQTPGGGASVVSIIPRPVQSTTGSSTETAFGTNTIQSIYMFNLPAAITVNKISLRTATTVTTAGTWDIVIYSEDGQTQKISITTASVSTGDTIITTAVSAVTLAAGNYYFAINPNGTASTEWCVWILGGGTVFGTTAGLNGDVTSEPILAGRITITASTPSTTFTPSSSIVENSLATVAPIFRLDN